ncbi:MAG: hypothetical protein JSV05_00880 [Candidatus Bathyarchaeota archaeon]|nr:MAG: hypothetical protein JSV05_00880 [Candidatus Bathyarchaeota archaeon]
MGEKEKENQLEEQVTEVLTTTNIAAIKRMLEKDHAIDCLFLLALDKGKWKKAKAYMNKHQLTLSDGTYRSRMIEITQLGLAKAIPIDPLKKQYSITKKGQKLATALLKLLQNL